MADGQDGAQTVDKARFDGLMASFNRVKAQADAAEARLAALEPADDGGDTADDVDDSEAQDPETDPGDSQQAEPEDEYEEGIAYQWDPESRKMVNANPTPVAHNEARPLRDTSVWDGPDYPAKGTSPAGEGFPV
jgi:hypothetical protein